LHHHLFEYPKPGTAFAVRIGTALVNGNWFVRKLQQLDHRAVVMHGHRHIDWIGECAKLLIVSAPSPVMEPAHEGRVYFYVQSLARDADGQLRLLAPLRITVDDDEHEQSVLGPHLDSAAS